MAFVTGPTSFYVMRLLLGAAEAGLYPGIIYYLTLWFGREERAKATGLFLLGVCGQHYRRAAGRFVIKP